MADLEVHPVADLFPMLAEDELRDLAEDIKTNGLLQPLVLDGEGRLLDGRNRLAACKLAGVEPEFTTYDGADPDAYALSVNLARRHLTTGARAVLAEQARRLNGSTKVETSKSGGLAEARLYDAALVIDNAPDLVPSVLTGSPFSKAVEEARNRKKAARSTEAQMERLRAEAPDLADLVEEERISLSEAHASVKQREQDRLDAIKRHQERLRQLVTGWVEIPALADNPDRDDILEGLTKADRESVLVIESIYQEGTKR